MNTCHDCRTMVIAVCFVVLFAAFASAQQMGVLTPLASTYGPQGTSTIVTPIQVTQPGSIVSWKGNFIPAEIPYSGYPGVPLAVQLKIFRSISATQIQVVAAGQSHDPRPAVAAIPQYPYFGTDKGIVEFAESGLSVTPGDLIAITITADPIAQAYYYTLVDCGADSRGVLHDVAVGDVIDLTDPFTSTFTGRMPALLLNPAIPINIAIKPGSYPHSINLSSAGVIPVAIFSSPTFDARTLDPDSLFLAGASVGMIGKSGKYQCSVDDVNADGLPDMLCHFETAQLMLRAGDTVAVLVGKTVGGAAVQGQDSVRIVPE